VETNFIESFNGQLRDECLNTHLFWRIEDAFEKIDAWRVDYNTLLDSKASVILQNNVRNGVFVTPDTGKAACSARRRARRPG
jgi:hypothetical protein